MQDTSISGVVREGVCKTNARAESTRDNAGVVLRDTMCREGGGININVKIELCSYRYLGTSEIEPSETQEA